MPPLSPNPASCAGKAGCCISSRFNVPREGAEAPSDRTLPARKFPATCGYSLSEAMRRASPSTDRAAFTSRSCTVPQPRQVQARSPNLSPVYSQLHVWHCWLEGKKRPTLIRVQPCHFALYSSCRRIDAPSAVRVAGLASPDWWLASPGAPHDLNRRALRRPASSIAGRAGIGSAGLSSRLSGEPLGLLLQLCRGGSP